MTHYYSLVAVIGGGGHAWGSFKERKKSHMWLVDDLPKDWSVARILVYGYGSKLRSNELPSSDNNQDLKTLAQTFSSSLSRVRECPTVCLIIAYRHLAKVAHLVKDQSKRIIPLVFLAHSVGGLLLKLALILMSKHMNTSERVNFLSTYAILFFGVPREGLNITELGLADMVKDQPSESFLKELHVGSEMLNNMHKEFCKAFSSHESTITSLYETEKSPTAELVRSLSLKRI